MPKRYRSLTILLAVWLLVWLRISWPAVQDDAFIHLRYAVNLLREHMISYDGVHPDYGTSSLLYVWLLAGLRTLFESPELPRAVSSVFHVTLFAGLAWAFPRALRSAPRLAWTLALLSLTILVMPMAVRWLDDGMETSLTLCLVSLLVFAISRLGHSRDFSRRSFAWLFTLGLVATLARIEFLLLMTVASVTLFFARYESAPPDGLRARLRMVASSTAPLFGSVVAAGVIYLGMHALIPDTAIAKADARAPWMSTLHATISVFVSAMSVGAILLLFWLLTAAAVVVYKRRVSLSMLAANSPFPVVMALAIQRGQQVQGVRYFVWTLIFPILWNILELRWSETEPRPLPAHLLRFAAYAVVCLLVITAPIESILLYREFRAREHSLAQFRTQHLERLSSLKLVAFDVGYIGYFTQSPLCDMAGLVNGRASAALPFEDRVKACAAEHPQYAFVSGFSLWELGNSLDLKGWSVCSEYDFANLRAPDLHYLIASPAATPEVCRAAGGSSRPLETILHPASP
ncbi:MAG: hypothetical protein ABR971_10185 [Acidobacteriaceae bacterium]|jgi:hypothetical protein